MVRNRNINTCSSSRHHFLFWQSQRYGIQYCVVKDSLSYFYLKFFLLKNCSTSGITLYYKFISLLNIYKPTNSFERFNSMNSFSFLLKAYQRSFFVGFTIFKKISTEVRSVIFVAHKRQFLVCVCIETA